LKKKNTEKEEGFWGIDPTQSHSGLNIEKEEPHKKCFLGGIDLANFT
jgi:hypothetical protein